MLSVQHKSNDNKVKKRNKIGKEPFVSKNVNRIRGTEGIRNVKIENITGRQLQNKLSLKKESDILYDDGGERLNFNQKYGQTEGNHIFSTKLNTIRTSLSSRNLKLLQRNIGELETATDICSHYLCSNENMKTVDFSRLWFLFELEMSVNGGINLRNECYYKKVYAKIDPNWPQSNCLKEKLPSKIFEMQLTHIILPKPINIGGAYYHQKNSTDLSDMSLLIESVIEDESFLETTKQKKIPSNYLAIRDKKKVFDTININVTSILNEKSSPLNDIEKKLLTESGSSNKRMMRRDNKLSYFRS